MPRILTVAAVAALVATANPGVAAQGAAVQRAHGTVVTDTFWSQALAARKSLVVYLPPSYRAEPSRRYPVAYYLHGATGDETNWTKLGRLAQAMDSLVSAGMPEMIVAMPDGDAYSYYTTYNVLLTEAGCRQLMLPPGGSAARDCVAWPHYDDYMAYDVVGYVDRVYRTLATGSHRGIAGLSMGGYGAVTLAFQYPGLFGAAASHSGVLWPMERAPFGRGMLPRPAADSAVFAQIGARTAAQFRVVFGADSASWLARDPAALAARLRHAGRPLPALYVDAGTEDPYTPESRAFHDAMTALGVAVDYHEWPGGHTWDYWRARLPRSLAWMATRIGAPPGR